MKAFCQQPDASVLTGRVWGGLGNSGAFSERKLVNTLSAGLSLSNAHFKQVYGLARTPLCRPGVGPFSVHTWSVTSLQI